MGKRLDELAKSLANNQVSRRQALLRAVGGAGAAAVAAILPGKALADDETGLGKGLQSQCVRYCQSLFPVNSKDECTRLLYDLCVSEASMRQGPCYFINGAPGFTSGCTHTGCPPGQICCNGRCCEPELCGVFVPDTEIVNGRPIFTFNGNPCLSLNGGPVVNGGHWIVNGSIPFTQVCLGC